MPPTAAAPDEARPPGDFPPALSAHPAFNLAVNPFEPVVIRIPGEKTRYRYSGSGPLKPQDCKDHLQLYFNVYEWKDITKLHGLREGRLTVLNRPNAERAMVILISGFRGSGRTSALNLLKYEFAERSAVSPIVLEYNTKITTDRSQHAKEIAFILQRAARRMGYNDLADRLTATQKDWVAAVGEAAGSPETLFDIFKEDISDLVPGLSVVVALDAQDHKVTSDVWRPICRMLSRMSEYIIVSLSDREQAQHFRANLELGEFQVAWVDSPKVDEDKFTEFLSHRLSKERVAPTAPESCLTPFTPQALKVLFRSTETGAPAVKMPIAVAMSRLASVFQHKATALSKDVNNGVVLTAAQVLITGADMEAYLGGL
jgi:hypothetical protein